MKKLILLVILSITTASAQVLLTSYGSANSNPFTLTFTDGSFSQGTNSGLFTGSGTGLILRGSFSAVDLSSFGMPTSLSLSLTFNTTYSGTLDYLIGSSAGNVWGYSYTASSLSGDQTIAFNRNANNDAGSVSSSSINRAALTADNPNFTLKTLSIPAAIPEPSTYVAVFGASALGFAVWRRRRTAVK